MTRRGGSLAAMLAQGQQAAQEDEARAAPTRAAEGPPAPDPAPEARASFGSRLRPSLHRWLKGEVLRLEGELGRRVKLESVLEAVLLELREDPGLRERVQGRVGRE